MTACELCGKQGSLVHALIEKVQMEVCPSCAKFGQVQQRKDVDALLQRKREQLRPRHEEPQLSVVQDYAEKIRKKREHLGIKQVDLARMVAERESVIQKMESGQFEPPIDLARKLERHLHIHLVEQAKDELKLPLHEKAEGFTLGHFIKK